MNERAGHIIQYDKFYIHELDDLIDIRNDYVTWIQRQMYPQVSRCHHLHLFLISCGTSNREITLSTGENLNFCNIVLFMSLCPQGQDGVVTLCRYPFVFDAQAKTTLLQTDAVIQMQVTDADGFCLPGEDNNT